MSKKFLTNLDLTQNQILNVAVHNKVGPPSSPVVGQIYFDTTPSVLRMFFWDGTAWVDMSGDIQDVLGGAGLTASTSANGDVITLDVNVDNATIEVNSDSLRVKDLGITTGKLANSAVTTVKINANAVTFDKLQQVANLTVIGNVSGATANPGEVSIITDMNNSSTSTLATSTAIKSYIDTVVGGLGNLEGGWDVALWSSFPQVTSPAVIKKGDYWYATTAGLINTNTATQVKVNIGDVFVAKNDGAQSITEADWIVLETNRDQATTTVLGLVYIATDIEVQTGTDTVKAVTPSGLSARTATEYRTGIAELATQAETDAGTDDATIVTPLKLKTLLDNRTGGYAANIGGSGTSYALSHGLNTIDVIVMIKDNSTLEEVITDVVITDANTVTVSFATAPSANAYRVIIKK
jgi:hypothetical protein